MSTAIADVAMALIISYCNYLSLDLYLKLSFFLPLKTAKRLIYIEYQ